MEKRSQKTSAGLIRIAITGPESTGKSQLTEQLAVHYKTVFVPEFARDYVESLGREYNFEDLELIAKGQIRMQKAAEKKAGRLLFCDTELTVIKIWGEHKYNKCPAWVSENLSKYTYDLYLLCNVDLPWEFDPLREHPRLRTYFFDWYQRELTSRNANIKVVDGTGIARFQKALGFIEELLQKKAGT